MAQITQRNTASCIISQRKTDLDGGEVCCFGVRLRNLRDLRETLGLICADRLSTLMCYSPADGADHAEEYSKAALFRRERQFVVRVVLCFVCVNLRDTLGLLW